MISQKHTAFWLAAGLLVLIGLMAGCSAGESAAVQPTSVLDQAAAEATAIVEQARATALIQQAQAEATALFEKNAPASPIHTLPPPSTLTALPTSLAQETPSETLPATASSPPATAAESGGRLEILSVSYGADGAYLVVNFLADPQVAQTFWPGVLSLTNESNGVVYNEVPVLPIIGPLIARPREYGQPGYFMLVNAPEYLAPGSLVTVKCGEFEFEHILVQ